LVQEQKNGHDREIVGVEIDWTSVERVYDEFGLPPAMPAIASRVAVPVYKNNAQIGKATSTTWSPALKKLIALATIKSEHAQPGSEIEIEVTVEAVRHRVPAMVVKTPFFNPKRKTATPLG
jgi:aminomethyltransferase